MFKSNRLSLRSFSLFPARSLKLFAETIPAVVCNIKRSFLDYVDDIEKYADQTSDTTNFIHALTAVHSGSINTFIDSLSVSGVLVVKPPARVPRESRVTLAQLRSGYCSRLNFYLFRIDPDIPNIYPACNVPTHDTNHLFACPMNPTHLTLFSL